MTREQAIKRAEARRRETKERVAVVRSKRHGGYFTTDVNFVDDAINWELYEPICVTI